MTHAARSGCRLLVEGPERLMAPSASARGLLGVTRAGLCELRADARVQDTERQPPIPGLQGVPLLPRCAWLRRRVRRPAAINCHRQQSIAVERSWERVVAVAADDGAPMHRLAPPGQPATGAANHPAGIWCPCPSSAARWSASSSPARPGGLPGAQDACTRSGGTGRRRAAVWLMRTTGPLKLAWPYGTRWRKRASVAKMDRSGGSSGWT